MTQVAALEMRDISKRFGAVVSLESVSFSARYGSVHALLGENGAGKTTLMRIAFGLIRADAGSVAINGDTLDLQSPSDAITAGIGMVHQQFSLIPAMTVVENVALGGRGRFNRDSTAARIVEIGRDTGLVIDPLARVSSLGSAERQKLEIVRTLAHNARVLILDEPTAVLTPRDTSELFAQLRSFAASGGCVVLITHKLHDALAHADEVTVLRRGRVALNAAMADVTRESLTIAMIGQGPEQSRSSNRDARPDATVTASLSRVVTTTARSSRRTPLDLQVFAGEVLGVAALEGAAFSLLRVLAGRIRPVEGHAEIPRTVGFVPENRLDEAIVPEFTLGENFALKGSGSRRGLLPWNEMKFRADQVVHEFEVVTPDSDAAAETLSGGNQQRFVLGRELEGNPSLVVLENPTQGLDVKAAAAIHARVRKAASDGAAIIFYSSDLDELAELADRVMVVSASGAKACAPDRDAIGRLLLDADTGSVHG